MKFSQSLRNAIMLFIFAIFSVLVCFRLFYHINYMPLADNDETWHVKNVFEMYKTGNWVVNTFNYSTDYFNSKPPLSLWMILLVFKIIGPSIGAARYPSAIAGIVLFISIAIFLRSRFGFRSTVIYGGAFLLLRMPFDFHMFRTANMDSLYNLFIAVGVIALYMAQFSIDWLYLYGVALGLVFLTKGPLVINPVLIGFLSLPLIYKKDTWRWKKVVISCLLAVLPSALWMIIRYQYDQTAFFNALFIGEVSRKTSHLFTLGFLKEAATEKVFLCLYAFVFLRVLQIIVKCRGTTSAVNMLKADMHRTMILWIWFSVPLTLHTIAGQHYSWYGYPSYIAASVLIAVYFELFLSSISADNKLLCCSAVVISVAFFAACAIYGVYQISHYPKSFEDTGGNTATEFRNDLLSVLDKYGNKYSGKRAYIQNVKISNAEEEYPEWHNELQVYSEYICDFQCVNGSGISGFLDDPDCVLVLNKSLWDKYSGILAGYIILEDGQYLIFSKEKY